MEEQRFNEIVKQFDSGRNDEGFLVRSLRGRSLTEEQYELLKSKINERTLIKIKVEMDRDFELLNHIRSFVRYEDSRGKPKSKFMSDWPDNYTEKEIEEKRRSISSDRI